MTAMKDWGWWARAASKRILKEYSDETCVETADYRLCGFILAAASLARTDPEVAAKIGALMERPRSKTHQGWWGPNRRLYQTDPRERQATKAADGTRIPIRAWRDNDEVN